jgi:hypothetical protein
MSSPYLQPVASTWARVAGIALLAAGLACTGFLARELWLLATDGVARRQFTSSNLIFGLILLALCGFCWQAGYRLAMSRPGPNGSLFSRPGWAAIGAGLLGMAGLMSFAIVTTRSMQWNDLYVVAGLASFGVWCFVLALRRGRRS